MPWELGFEATALQSVNQVSPTKQKPNRLHVAASNWDKAYNNVTWTKIVEHYVHFIATTAVPKAMNLEDVKSTTSPYRTILKAMDLVRTGRWFEIKTLHDPNINLEELQELSHVRKDNKDKTN